MHQIPKRFRTRTADRALAGMLGPVTCIIQLEMSFDHKLDEKRLEKAIHLTVQRLPLLGCRFVPRPFRPYFDRLDTEGIDLFCLTTDPAFFNTFINGSMDFFTGPQIQACLYRSGSKDRFLIKVSHLVCDAAGVKEIAEELSIIYNRLKKDPAYIPEPVIDDYRGFWQVLQQIPWSAVPRILYNFICEIYGSNRPGQSHVLPVQKTEAHRVQLNTRHLDKSFFAGLEEYAKEQQVTINDLLVTAIIRALAQTGELTQEKAIRLGMAVDLRRYLPGRQIGAIGNFSSLELFNHGNHLEKEFQSTLIRVSRKINRRKSSWLGLNAFVSTYPILWGLPFFMLQLAGRKGWEIKSNAPNSYDWLTNMGVIPKTAVDFDGPASTAWLLVPGCILPMLFFGSSSYDGTLTFSWSTSSDGRNKEVTHSFFDLLISELESAIRPGLT